MDDQRFDNLSRIIARSTTRRATVKGIAAAIGGGVFAGVFGVRAQRAMAESAEPGGACNSNRDCTTGLCSAEGRTSGFCYCEDPARPWLGCDCIPDPSDQGQCVDVTLICCADGAGGVCTSASTGCPPTSECNQGPGQVCSGDEECCTGTCMSGVCACLTDTEPWLGCPCDREDEPRPCGMDGSLVC